MSQSPKFCITFFPTLNCTCVCVFILGKSSNWAWELLATRIINHVMLQLPSTLLKSMLASAFTENFLSCCICYFPDLRTEMFVWTFWQSIFKKNNMPEGLTQSASSFLSCFYSAKISFMWPHTDTDFCSEWTCAFIIFKHYFSSLK